MSPADKATSDAQWRWLEAPTREDDSGQDFGKRGKKMRASKRKRLEANGWRLTSAEEFLGLTREELAFVEMKLALADAVKAQREKSHLSQVELAARMKSSQSRVAKIEAGDPSVSLDLLVRAVLSAGATKKEVARALAASAR